MKFDERRLRLYAVTDRAWTGRQSLYEQVECALRGGATCVQLREKALDEAEFLREARQLRALCRRYDVPFIVNDNVEVALACGADGVHVGQEDLNAACVRERVGPDMLIGVSAHSVKEAVQAVENGADYLGVGAMFSTSTKADANVLPADTLRAICAAAAVPVVAIGGITADNLERLAGTGIAGVALVSAIFSAEDIAAACRTLRSRVERLATV